MIRSYKPFQRFPEYLPQYEKLLAATANIEPRHVEAHPNLCERWGFAPSRGFTRTRALPDRWQTELICHPKRVLEPHGDVGTCCAHPQSIPRPVLPASHLNQSIASDSMDAQLISGNRCD
jgi:hypothetical protein